MAHICLVERSLKSLYVLVISYNSKIQLSFLGATKFRCLNCSKPCQPYRIFIPSSFLFDRHDPVLWTGVEQDPSLRSWSVLLDSLTTLLPKSKPMYCSSLKGTLQRQGFNGIQKDRVAGSKLPCFTISVLVPTLSWYKVWKLVRK